MPHDDEMEQTMQDDPDTQLAPAQETPRRSAVRTFFGWLLVVVAGLAVLGTLANLGSGNAQGPSNGAEMLGQLIGAALLVALPLVVGLLLLRRPKA